MDSVMQLEFHRLPDFPQGALAFFPCGSPARELIPSEVIQALHRAQTSCWVKGPEKIYEKTFSTIQDNFLGAKERVIQCVLSFQEKQVRLTADGDQCWEACKEIKRLSDPWNSHTPTQETLL